MIAFVGSMSLATAVLLPERTLRFSVFGSRLFEQEVQDDVFDIGETHRRLAYFLDGYHGENDAKLERLFVFYRIATGFLLIEVGFWSLQLALS